MSFSGGIALKRALPFHNNMLKFVKVAPVLLLAPGWPKGPKASSKERVAELPLKALYLVWISLYLGISLQTHDYTPEGQGVN